MASRRLGKPSQGFAPIGTARHDLREHRVEASGHLVAGSDPGIDADALAARPLDGEDGPRRRQEARLRVLGVEADLHRVAAQADVGLREPEPFAGRDPDLVGDEVSTGHQLRDGMLHLEARVHLQEEDVAAVVEEELACPGADVSDLAPQGQRRLGQALPRRLTDGGRGRLLEHLLVSPLDGAIALAEVDAVPVSIEEQLDLDVSRPFEEPLQDQAGHPRTQHGPRAGPRRGQPSARRAHGPSACPCRHRRPRA